MEKSEYLSFKNAKGKTAEWMDKLLFQKKRHPDFIYKPESSALLVIDMQNYFLDSNGQLFIPVGSFILSQIKKMVLSYYDRELPVIFTRYCVTQREENDIMNRWWGNVLLEDDPISYVTDELDTGKGTVILKPAYSSFYKTELDSILKDLGAKQVVITGVMTHLCCETTARDAFQRGYEVYFVMDGTGTYNEEIHTATLFNLAHGFAVPVTTQEILEKLKK